MEIGMYRCKDEIESGSTLKLTGGNDRPKAFSSFSACFTACSLSDMAINHNKPNRLFSNVVRGIHFRRGDKGKIGFTMFTKSNGHVFNMLF